MIRTPNLNSLLRFDLTVIRTRNSKTFKKNMFKKYEPTSQTLLKSSQTRNLKQKLAQQMPTLDFDLKKVVSIKHSIDLQIYSNIVIEYQNLLLPTMFKLFENIDCLPRLIVDQGAIKFVLKGADIMAPGIVELPMLEKGTQVAIFALGKRLPLAVGILNINSQELFLDGKLKPKESRSGIACLNVHYINDQLYKAIYKCPRSHCGKYFYQHLFWVLGENTTDIYWDI